MVRGIMASEIGRPPIDIIIRTKVLQRDRGGAEILLRAGAILNAIMSSGRTLGRSAASIEEKRDQVQAWIHTAAYLTELHKLMARRHDGLGWKLAEEGERRGLVLPGGPTVATLKAMLTPRHQFFETCKVLREKLAFHLDADAFLQWLADSNPEGGISVLAQAGPRVRDFVSSGSAQAVLTKATQEISIADFPNLLAQVVRGLPALLEAMCMGFAVRWNLFVSTNTIDGVMLILLDESPIQPTQR